MDILRNEFNCYRVEKRNLSFQEFQERFMALSFQKCAKMLPSVHTLINIIITISKHGSLQIKCSNLVAFLHAKMSCQSVSKHVHVILVTIINLHFQPRCLSFRMYNAQKTTLVYIEHVAVGYVEQR